MRTPHLLLATALLLTGGCNLIKLDHEMQLAHQELQLVSGQLQTTEDKRSALVALLDNKGKLVAYRIASPDEVFYFIVPTGTYQLLAFDDQNGNFRLDPDEPHHWIKQARTSPLTVQPSSTERAHLGELNPLHLQARTPTVAPRVDLNLKVLYQEHPRFKRNYLHPIDLNDERFNETNTRMGTWQPVSFVNNIGYGLYLLSPWDDKKEPVLMVHGINSSPRDWAFLTDKMDKSRYQPVLFHYPSGLPLDNSAYILSVIIRDLQLRHSPKRLHVVAHSMGGLVSRRALQLLNEDYHKPVCLFATLSTPWGGHPMAAQGVHDVPLDIPLWRDLAPGSPFLKRLFNQPLPKHIRQWQLVSYGGNRHLLTQPNDGVVPLSSELLPAAQEEAGRLYLLEDSHTGILTSERSALLLGRALKACSR